MRQDRRTPDEVALVGVQETNLRDCKSGGFERDSKPKPSRVARGWSVTVRAYTGSNPNRRGYYFVSISNGVIFVGFWGHTTTNNALHAKLEAEFKGALSALDWLKHETPETYSEIRFSAISFSVFMGEAPCPLVLKPLLDRARRAYIAASDSVSIDRERHALVAGKVRVAA